MVEVISYRWQKARKVHRCDYCRERIEKGSIYRRDFCKDGKSAYSWKTCDKCETIVTGFWDWVSPDDGLDSQDFYDACKDFVCHFLCTNEDRELRGCNCDEDFVFRTYQALKDNELIFDVHDMLWKLKRKQVTIPFENQ